MQLLSRCNLLIYLFGYGLCVVLRSTLQYNCFVTMSFIYYLTFKNITLIFESIYLTIYKPYKHPYNMELPTAFRCTPLYK